MRAFKKQFRCIQSHIASRALSPVAPECSDMLDKQTHEISSDKSNILQT